MITTISFKKSFLTKYLLPKDFTILQNINKINVFVGTNNSGKSRFLREICNNVDEAQLVDIEAVVDLKALERNIKNLETQYLTTLVNLKRFQNQFKDDEKFSSLLKRMPDTQNVDSLDSFLELLNELMSISKKDVLKPSKSLFNEDLAIKELNRYASNIHNETFQILNSKNLDRLYIPILRGLRPINYEENRFSNRNVYLDRTKHDYFKGKLNTTIYTGLSLYEDIMKLLLGTEEERSEIIDFEIFLEKYIFNLKVTLIPKYNDDVLHIKIGEEQQLEIFNLGDGLQTIIAVLFPIFLARNKKTAVFIEEPEVHLHPEWQTKLLYALKTFNNHQFFITSHSSSFINDKDASVFNFIRSNKKSLVSIIDDDFKKSELISELGYKPSDLLLTNYILWVEGPSDKIYIKRWIELMDPNLVEGKHYSIMFYGGDTYRHFLMNGENFDLSFIKKLNGNFGLIMDSDRKNKHEAYSKTKKELEILFHESHSFFWLTKSRELENYIDFELFKETVKKVHKKNNIEIGSDNFDDRNTIMDLDSKPNYSAKIKLPEELFSKIQKNGNGSIDGIDDKALRNGIELALKESSSNKFKTNKILIAKELIKNPDFRVNKDIEDSLTPLIRKIKKANNLTL